MLNLAIRVGTKDLVGLSLVTLGTKVLLSQVLAGMSITLSPVGRRLCDLLDRDSMDKGGYGVKNTWSVHKGVPRKVSLGIPKTVLESGILLCKSVC